MLPLGALAAGLVRLTSVALSLMSRLGPITLLAALLSPDYLQSH